MLDNAPTHPSLFLSLTPLHAVFYVQVRQFDEWNLEVYGKIQGRVAEKLDNVTPKQLTRRRNQEFQKFLDTTNTKGAIFRDIIIESEYDPLEPNRQCVKVRSVILSLSLCQC